MKRKWKLEILKVSQVNLLPDGFHSKDLELCTIHKKESLFLLDACHEVLSEVPNSLLNSLFIDKLSKNTSSFFYLKEFNACQLARAYFTFTTY